MNEEQAQAYDEGYTQGWNDALEWVEDSPHIEPEVSQ